MEDEEILKFVEKHESLSSVIRDMLSGPSPGEAIQMFGGWAVTRAAGDIAGLTAWRAGVGAEDEDN